ncbi:MAG: pyridoxamine 5'-phosphate oxidase [Gammaproteobacteria bacterium]|jgi:pyridoxamine 5'-phosphate oxidase
MSQDLSDLRREYIARGLNEDEISPDPVQQFELWFQEVQKINVDLANAMVLATASSNGLPSARYVLLKEYSDKGFVFYTNSLSQKGKEIHQQPQVALVFYWKELHRQIRIEGNVELLSSTLADKYFASRPRGSQISSWVATQSEVIPHQQFMHDKVNEITKRYTGKDIPRPESWLGYRVIPQLFEFWQGQENRLHDRIIYRLENNKDWLIHRLAP